MNVRVKTRRTNSLGISSVRGSLKMVKWAEVELGGGTNLSQQVNLSKNRTDVPEFHSTFQPQQPEELTTTPKTPFSKTPI